MNPYRKSLICAIYPQIIMWLLTLILCYPFFMPEWVMAVEEDQYRFNTVRLDVDLTYLKDTFKINAYDTPEKTESFEQRYKLDAKGLVMHPNLMTYRAGIEYVDTATETTNRGTHSNVDSYTFDTTILRKSRIPLTLAARRITTDTGVGAETTRDTFGADWHLKFRTLPWTRLNYDKTQTKSADRYEDVETSGIEMSKKIGPTDNTISYSTTTTSSDRNYGAENNVITIRNDTTVPRVADFYLGVVKNDYIVLQDNNKRVIETTAGSAGVRTEPVAGLDQNYNYTFTNTKSAVNRKDSSATDIGPGETNSEFFNGKIGYKPTKRLNLFMDAQTFQNETLSETRDTLSKYIKFSTGGRYSITRELSTTESIRYSQAESSTGDPLTGKTERTITDTTAALNYAKKLSWSAFSAGVSLGHYKETVKPDAGGEGTSYSFNTGLSGINMNYFTLSSGYSYSAVESNSSSNVDQEVQEFSSNAVSSYIRDLPLTVSYLYHTMDSYLDGEDGVENTVSATASVHFIKWLPINASLRRYTLVRPDNAPSGIQMAQIRDKEEDTISLSSNLIYFKNTTISALSEYNTTTQSLFNADTGVPEENSYSQRSIGIKGSHTRALYRGKLNISTEYKESIKEDIVTNIKEDYSSLLIKGQYDKKLSRNMLLSLKAERSDADTNGLRDTTTVGETDIFYRLRQWLLSAEYLHSIKEMETSGGLIVTEDRVMLRLSRSFVRIF